MPNTTVTFENPTLADAVNKANKVAPRKGAAYDKAAGILIEVDPAQGFAVIKATDTEITYEQRIPLLEGHGEFAAWRIPSSILQGVITNLPLAQGASVDFIDRNDPAVIRFKSDRMVAKLNCLKAEEFPKLPEFTTDGMTPASELASKVDQVSFAVDTKSPVLSGIHVDGARIIACNQYFLALVPCPVAITDAVTVPLAAISQMLKAATDVRVRANGKRFEMMLDAETKASTTILEGNYPKIDPLLRTDWYGHIKVHKQQFVETLNRMMVMVQNEKSPTLVVEINGGGLVKMLTFDMEIKGTGRMQDSIDVSSEDFDGVYNINFIPRMLQAGAEHVKGDYFDLSFGVISDPSKYASVRIMDDTGYTCIIMPKKREAE